MLNSITNWLVHEASSETASLQRRLEEVRYFCPVQDDRIQCHFKDHFSLPVPSLSNVDIHPSILMKYVIKWVLHSAGSYYTFQFFPSIALYKCFGVHKWLSKLQYHKVATRGSKWLPQITVTALSRNDSLGFHPRLYFTSGTRWRRVVLLLGVNERASSDD